MAEDKIISNLIEFNGIYKEEKKTVTKFLQFFPWTVGFQVTNMITLDEQFK